MVVENSNMSGNIGITAMFLLGAVGISGLIISNQMTKSTNMIEESKMQRAVDSASLANLSQLSRLKGLLSIRPTPNLGAGAVAGFYPVNYFSQNWTFDRQPGLDINGVSLVDGNTFKIFELPTDFTSATPSFSQNFSTVTITQQIRDPNAPSLVTHVEVSVSSAVEAGGRAKIDKALIPIDKPKGGNPVLQIFDGGSFRNLKAYESLSTGNRRFRVLADGVVLDAIIYVNGNMLNSMVAGYDSSGLPLSHANSSVGKGQVIGEFSTNLVSLLNPKLSQSSDLIRYDTWNKVCNFNTFDPFGPTELAILQVGLRYADNSTDSQSSLIDIPLLLKVPKGKGSPYNKESQETVDPFNFLDQCPQACDTYGYGTAYGKQDIINSSNWANYFGKAFFNQIYTGQYQDLLHWTAGAIVGNHYAICDNARGIGENEDPAVRNMTAPDWYSHQDLIAYNMKCQPQFVFERSFCGCFKSDTLITLENGAEKEVSTLTKQDRVFNPITKSGYPIRKLVQGPEKKPLLKITIKNQVVEVTSEHPFLTAHGLRPASKLAIGMMVLGEDGSYEAISNIEEKHYENAPTVWNLELDTDTNSDNHYVLANGIVTGDLFLQNLLRKK